MASAVDEKPRKERGRQHKKRKIARNLSPASQQRHELQSLLAKPDQEIPLPWKEKGMELLPPDILLNIQGSSAGAGSGEFHVYKAARKREFERIRKFEVEIEREESEKQFLKERKERARILAEKTAKNRRRREKKKGRKDADEGDGGARSSVNTGEFEPAPPDGLDGADDDDEAEVPEGLLVVEDDL